MSPLEMPSLVAADWLERHRSEPDLRILDARWYLPGSGQDPREAYRAAHIPGAVFLDIDGISDPDSPLPHMLPNEGAFAAAAGALGVDNASRIVVYDDATRLFSAARAWWMFRVFGHSRVAILDGGLRAWSEAGLPVESGDVEPQPRAYHATLDAGAVRAFDEVRRNVESRAEQVVDARPAGRFSGTDPEPRPGLVPGHIPGSTSLPFDRVSDPATGRMLAPAALDELFAGLDERPVVCSCGTGVTACVLAFALDRIGRTDVAVYDGSWTEWAGRGDAPIETGYGGDADRE